MATSLSETGAPLLVAFGGFAGGLGIHPSEFFDLTKDIRAKWIVRAEGSLTGVCSQRARQPLG